MFKDRIEAGKMLAAKLRRYHKVDIILLAVPLGGVPVASAIAKETGWPVDIVLAKKIGHLFIKNTRWEQPALQIILQITMKMFPKVMWKKK